MAAKRKYMKRGLQEMSNKWTVAVAKAIFEKQKPSLVMAHAVMMKKITINGLGVSN